MAESNAFDRNVPQEWPNIECQVNTYVAVMGHGVYGVRRNVVRDYLQRHRLAFCGRVYPRLGPWSDKDWEDFLEWEHNFLR